MSDADRISALEAEVCSLKLLLGAQAKTLTPVPRPAERSVQISHPAPRQLTLPTDAEFHQLQHVVLDRYPQFAPRADREGFAEQFKVAFERLLHVGRQARLDVSRDLAFWTDDVRVWQRQRQIGLTVFVGSGALMAAIVAHGDIPYAPLDRFPFDLGFGLVPHGGGAPSSEKWRDVLTTGNLREPTPLDRPTAIRSPATVRRY